MQLRHFVSGSAVILSAWLTVTFFHEVPSQRYLQPASRTSATDSKPAAPAQAGRGNSELAEVSSSR